MKHIKAFFLFIQSAIKHRFVIQQLVKRDFQNKYLASYIGLPWVFIQPAILIAVMWFAFSFGLKIQVMDGGVPFVFWLICGMIPWMFLSDALNFTTHSLVEFSYLIKKTSFNMGIIPFIKIFTALIIHIAFLFLLMIISIGYGYYPTVYWFQIIYYLFASFILITGLGWLVSALTVFIRDIGQVVMAVISILFWATPIIWPFSKLGEDLEWIALFNPFFYLIEGYRYTFIDQVWFFESLEMNIYFWSFTSVIFIAGATVFRKLKGHFADVL